MTWRPAGQTNTQRGADTRGNANACPKWKSINASPLAPLLGHTNIFSCISSAQIVSSPSLESFRLRPTCSSRPQKPPSCVSSARLRSRSSTHLPPPADTSCCRSFGSWSLITCFSPTFDSPCHLDPLFPTIPSLGLLGGNNIAKGGKQTTTLLHTTSIHQSIKDSTFQYRQLQFVSG